MPSKQKVTASTKHPNHQKSSGRLTKGQRLDAMARKKDERAVRKEKKKTTSSNCSGDEKRFAEQLATIGLNVRDIVGDGNCLFRALGDQLDGDDRLHARHRQDVVRYITEHRADFEPFIEDDVPFDQHVQNLAIDGTHAGNDSIVAFARLHKLTVIIHQLDSPAWEVHGESELGSTSSNGGGSGQKARQLHISYHNGDHYASVRRVNDFSDGPANVRIEPTRPLPPMPPSVAKGQKKSVDHEPTVVSVVQNGVAAEADTDVERIPTTLDPSDSCDNSNAHFIDKVIEFTRCHNRQLVADLCSEANYFDIENVCAHVLAFMDGVHSSSGSSVPSDGDEPVTATADGSTGLGQACARPKVQQRQAASAARRQRKRDKKARAELRHKVAVVGAIARQISSDEDDMMPFVITQNLKVLQI
jgi:OTU domain-containing protein 3